ncbi:MAG TPA: TIGR03617 family F420-dependent LLM class oxidoreductase [Acidimicrobiales bacterium]|jgi:probable F420-dependent oxidoreductase|nr:TIGR03617 family F420-dependent LLM class oxidoreductase [Acidimicrobiales bacterium]
MEFDAVIGGVGLRDAQRFASDVEGTGFSGLWFTEGGRTAYLGCAAAALASSTLTIGTGVAVAFPRSPMITAKVAWELADATAGRFVLGLGTQVKAHVERRYSAAYDHPGPRLREYVLSLRAIFTSFQTGEPLRYEGEFFRFTIGKLGDAWSGGPIATPDVPIYLAGVRPWMLQMIGEVADGLHVHPFHSPRYVAEVVRPNVELGAMRSDRDLASIALACPVLTIVGDTEEQREHWRRRARMQIAFYGSTRTYRGVFELHGWHGVAERLHELQRAGDVAGMAATITDEMLDAYAVTSSWDDLADRLVARYQGLANRLIMYFAGSGWRESRGTIGRWAEVARAVRAA